MPKFEGRRGLSPAAQITAAIIEKLEQGTRPWAKPWRGVRVSRPLRSCGTPYRGVNTFWLWMIAEAAGFMSPYWMTYRQCQKPGGQVRKGEKSTIAIFYKSYDKQVERADGERGDPEPPCSQGLRGVQCRPVRRPSSIVSHEGCARTSRAGWSGRAARRLLLTGGRVTTTPGIRSLLRTGPRSDHAAAACAVRRL